MEERKMFQDLIELLLAKKAEAVAVVEKIESMLEQCDYVEPVVEVEPQPQEPVVEEQPQVEVNDGAVIY